MYVGIAPSNNVMLQYLQHQTWSSSTKEKLVIVLLLRLLPCRPHHLRRLFLCPPKYWAGLVNKDSIRYSNNGAESFHSHFKHAFTGKNKKPNIFEFLVALGHFNIHNKVKLQSFKTLPPNKFSNFKDDHDKLLSGDMSIALFLKTLCKKYELPLNYR